MKQIVSVLCAAALLLSGMTQPLAAQYTAPRLPNAVIQRVPPVSGTMHGVMNRLPEPDESGAYDLRDADLTGCDLTDAGEALRVANFSSKTKWPVRLPQGFDAAATMELGKDPGLGLRALHEKGITGKGVGVAIIDQTLLVGHEEYADRLRYYREHGRMATFHAQMHGPAVASAAVGKTCGVAPDALLYYIADAAQVEGPGFTSLDDISNRAKDIDELVALNATLPADEKIRVISISRGWSSDKPGADKLDAAVARARAAGIAVVYISESDPLVTPLFGMGREWMSDPNAYTGRVPAYWIQEDVAAGDWNAHELLLVPMDARTLAAPTGNEDYVYYAYGGMSWAVPYWAGLYALACQVKPEVTFEEFLKAAQKTARPVTYARDGKMFSMGRAVDPEALFRALTK